VKEGGRHDSVWWRGELCGGRGRPMVTPTTRRKGRGGEVSLNRSRGAKVVVLTEGRGLWQRFGPNLAGSAVIRSVRADGRSGDEGWCGSCKPF
jgi:hypothetical protein